MDCSWSGNVTQFLALEKAAWVNEMKAHYRPIVGEDASPEQVRAWQDCHKVVHSALHTVVSQLPVAADWHLLFEYVLPREGGRRPDLIILSDAITVVEFKQKSGHNPADLDQVQAYARDIASYHAASHGRAVYPILVPTRSAAASEAIGSVQVSPPAYLAEVLITMAASSQGEAINPAAWLAADYAPLPTLVQAACAIFRKEELPQIRRADSAGIPETLAKLACIAREARDSGTRTLALLTGVPGAGKTLAGLQFVYECGEEALAAHRANTAVFLSGNGPLVDVLQYTLKSRVFVQPMRNFIKQYGINQRPGPAEHVLVFDEAQRAWDMAHVQETHGVAASEPDLLVRIAERRPGWAMLLGLIGEGQEIHNGEEAGLAQWNAALQSGSVPWTVYCPERLRSYFPAAHAIHTTPVLDLDTSLRTHQAEDVQRWIAALLGGQVHQARALAQKMHAQGFCMYITRRFETATNYVRARYRAEPEKRYGLVASSQDRILPRFGIDNTYNTTKRLKFGPWYQDKPWADLSCCQLQTVATEFGCQGLELDLPIVCWGNDLFWRGAHWQQRPIRSKAHDPFQLSLNKYRVLLSRGRDGFVIFIPPVPELDETYRILQTAGVRLLSSPAIEQIAAPGQLPDPQ